jgi:mono/diheme cytochrome c family protein
MPKTITTLLAAALVIVLIGAAVVYSGVINVAADEPHASPIQAILETARERSIAVRAKNIAVPDLRDANLIQSGAGNYDAMCVGCHLAPGITETELSQNLYPAPPSLADADRKGDPAGDFWVIKHGIKATGMPAWGKSMDDPYIWGLVAILEQLPSLSAVEYRALVDSSDGHQHGGGESGGHDHSGEQAATGDHHGGRQQGNHQQSEPQSAADPDVHHHADGSKHVH